VDSQKLDFRFEEFSEVRILGILGSSDAANLATEALHTPVSSAVDEGFTAVGQAATVAPLMSKPSATLTVSGAIGRNLP
jgi:hypothetical protein